MADSKPNESAPFLPDENKLVDLDGVPKVHNGPKYRPNCCSALTFWPATPIISSGSKQSVEHHQLWQVRNRHKAATAWKEVKSLWTAEVRLSKDGGEPSLFRAVRRAFLGHWLFIMLLLLINGALAFVTPVLIPYLLTFLIAAKIDPNVLAAAQASGAPLPPALADAATVQSWHGYVYVAGIFVATIIGSFCNYHAQLLSYALGVRIRSAFTLLMYKKALFVRPSQNFSTGKITNLIATDAQFVLDTITFFNIGFIAPLQIIAATVLVGIQLGWFCLIPIGLFILAFPISGVLGKKSGEARTLQQAATDSRVKFVKEFVSAIRIVKYYAWEKPFARNIAESREAELVQLKNSLAIRAEMIMVLQNIPNLGIALLFVFYGIGHSLDFSAVFTSVALLNLLRGPFILLPLMLFFGIQYKVTFERVQDFLLQPELQRRPKEDETAGAESKYAIVMDKASFSYTPEDDKVKPILKDINLKIKRGTLTMVIGRVGSGKSSLVHAAINEVSRVSGDSHTYGSVAYAPQEAWIINATIRDNICFGKAYDQKFFNHIVKICCLEPDFDMMPGRDLTEIGERGVNLSGGQKQRISIARALYADRDVYVLDDILSAVDSQVGKELAQKVVLGHLKAKGKTILFVTNQLQYLPVSDNIVMMHKGKIAEKGTYTELKDAGKAFSKLMSDFGLIEENKKKAEASNGSPERSRRKADTTASPKPARSEDAELKKGALVSAEESEVGNIGGAVYNRYIIYGGRVLFSSIFMTFVLRVAARTFNGLWLSYWAQDFPENPDEHMSYSNTVWITIYLATVIAEILGGISGAVLQVFFAIKASRVTNNKMMQKLSRATIAWYDATPVGRLLSRVAKDLQMVDTQLPQSYDQAMHFSSTILGLFAQLAIGNLYLLIVVFVVVVVYFILFSYFRRSSIAIQRLESISRAPIISHMSQSLEGAATIRAFRLEKNFQIACMNKIDNNTVDFYGLRYCFSWFGLRLDWCGTGMIVATYLAIVLSRNYALQDLDVSFAALAMSSTAPITFLMAAMSQAFIELETKMNSFERLTQYDDLPEEPALHIEDKAPPKDWPAKGEVQFKKLSISYNGTDKVLNQISAKIKPREKVGLVGRTGAGKSTLVTALFRLMDFHEGTIIIDGVDVAAIGLHDLREKLSIIPQTPTLFIGTVRYNVDPFDQYKDDQIWGVLDMVQLKEYVSSLEGGLAAFVEENGQNFSVGQRQLLAMARALLRNAPILLLDEATAATDAASDQLIQKLIRKHFADKTIITIAHRLNTIMDSDRVMVLSHGKMIEFDKPATLLDTKGSQFADMVQATGPASAAYLTRIARGQASVLDAIPAEVLSESDQIAKGLSNGKKSKPQLVEKSE